MIGDIIDILLTPFAWAMEETVIFAVTAPINHIYIAMGTAFVLLLVLIWSMLPKKAKSHNVAPVLPQVYEATEEDERQAREILANVQAI